MGHIAAKISEAGSLSEIRLLRDIAFGHDPHATAALGALYVAWQVSPDSEHPVIWGLVKRVNEAPMTEELLAEVLDMSAAWFQVRSADIRAWARVWAQ